MKSPWADDILNIFNNEEYGIRRALADVMSPVMTVGGKEAQARASLYSGDRTPYKEAIRSAPRVSTVERILKEHPDSAPSSIAANPRTDPGSTSKNPHPTEENANHNVTVPLESSSLDRITRRGTARRNMTGKRIVVAGHWAVSQHIYRS